MIDNSQDEYIQYSFISDVIQSDKSDKNLQNTVSDTDSGISKVQPLPVWLQNRFYTRINAIQTVCRSYVRYPPG